MSEVQPDRYISENDKDVRECAERDGWDHHPDYGYAADDAQVAAWRKYLEKRKWCVNCRFWEKLDDSGPVYNLIGAPKKWHGFCHRYPPKRNDQRGDDQRWKPEDSELDRFVTTCHLNWCGEWSQEVDDDE